MRVFLVLAMISIGLVSTPADARPGRIYLFRGLANVFSTGMDTLTDELTARGYAASVHTHVFADGLASEAADLQKKGKGPIVIMGHSLGGGAAIAMARRMKELGAPVALIVTFGPTYNEIAPSNVARVVNYYQAPGIVTGTISKGPGFKGSLTNINLDKSINITHFNIDKSPALHAKTIAMINLLTTRSAPPPPAAAQAEVISR